MQLSSVPERINKHLIFRGGVGRKLKDGMCEEKREGRGGAIDIGACCNLRARSVY